MLARRKRVEANRRQVAADTSWTPEKEWVAAGAGTIFNCCLLPLGCGELRGILNNGILWPQELVAVADDLLAARQP